MNPKMLRYFGALVLSALWLLVPLFETSHADESTSQDTSLLENSGETFTNRHTAAAVIVDTTAKEPRFHGSVRLELGVISLEDVGDLAKNVPMKEVISKPKKANVLFVLPSDLSEEESKILLSQTQSKLSKNSPDTTFVLKAVRVDINDLKEEIGNANKEMEAVQDSFLEPDISEVARQRQLFQKLRRANEKLLKDFSSWAQSYRKNMRLLLQNPASKSLMFAGAVGIGTSAVPITTMVLSAGSEGISPFLFFQCLQVLTYDQLNSTGSGKLLEFEMKHEIPFARNNRIVRAYNSGTFAKAASVNFAVNFLNVIWWNQLAHWQNPDVIAHPSYADIGMGTLGVLAQATATSLSDVGVATLRSKGYLSARTEVLTLAALNLLNQMTNYSLARQAYGFYWAVLTAELTTKATIALGSKLLPARSDRIVLIHSELLGGKKEAVAKFVADVNEAVSAEGLSPEKFTELYGKNMVTPSKSVFEKSLSFSRNIYQAAWKKLELWKQSMSAFYKKSCYGIANKIMELRSGSKGSGSGDAS